MTVADRLARLAVAQEKHRAALIRINNEIKAIRAKCKHDAPSQMLGVPECVLCGAVVLPR